MSPSTERTSTPEPTPLVPYSPEVSETDQDTALPDLNAMDLDSDEELDPPSADAISFDKKNVMSTSINNTTPIIEGNKVCFHTSSKRIDGGYITKSDTNHSVVIEEENLAVLYQQKINKLMKRQLASDDVSEVMKIRELINELKSTLTQFNNTDKQEVDSNTRSIQNKNNNNNNNKKIDIPYFQLVDDPVSTKSENKPSYDNAEMFATTFEMILETNDVDINKYWKKYLPKAFLFSRNEKHHRWYTNNINPLNEKVKWSEIKEKLIDRFGNSANTANNIEKYLDMKQGPQESIRDYVDRYLESYRRLPTNKQPSDSIEAMKFIKSLLPKAREEVTNSLKKNKKHDDESYLPATLFDLFKYLEKNIGDIQEALYLAVTTSTNNSKHSNVEGFDNKKRSYNNDQAETSTAKKIKDNKTNMCFYCKTERFSVEHLNSCVKYLRSDKYKRWLINNAGNQESGNKVIQILYSNTENNINPIYNYSETYDLILEDYETFFEDFEPQNKLNRNKFLKKNDLNNNINNVSCYLVDGYSEKELEDLSPYSPFITINNEKLVSMLDTGATVSMINKAYDFEDRTVFDNVTIPPGILSFVNKGSHISRQGKTRPLEVKYRGKEAFYHRFEIIEMNDAKIPILIGRDLINKLGIYIENIAYNFDEKEEVIYNDTVDDSLYVPNESKACSETEY